MNLSGMASGMAAVYPGMVEGRSNEAKTALQEYQTQQAGLDLQALAARSRGLQLLFGGGMDAPSPQPPAPGESSVPAGGAPSGGGGSAPGPPGGAPFSNPGQRGQPAPAPAFNNSAPLGPDSAPPGAAAPMNLASGGGAGMPTGGGMSPVHVGAPVPQAAVAGSVNAPFDPRGIQQGTLTWPALVNAIHRANPGAPPAVLAKAVDQSIGMLTAQSQQEWRGLQYNLGMTREGGKNERFGKGEEGRMDRSQIAARLKEEGMTATNSRAQLRADTLDNISQRSTALKRELAEMAEGGKTSRVEFSAAARKELAQMNASDRSDIVQFQEAHRDERAAAAQEGADKRNTENNTTQRWKRSTQPITGVQAKQFEQGKKYDEGIRVLDDMLDLVEKHNTGFLSGVTGLGGRLGRLTEIAKTIGSKKGGETDANLFATQNDVMKTILPQLLTGRAISNPSERARMDRIVKGMSFGSTATITADDLLWLRKLLVARKPEWSGLTTQQDLMGARDSGGAVRNGQPQQAPLKPLTLEMKAAMDKALAEGHSRVDTEAFIRKQGFDPALEAK